MGVGVSDGFVVVVVGFGVGVRAIVGRGVAVGEGVGESVGNALVSGVVLGDGNVITVLAEGSGDCSGSGEI